MINKKERGAIVVEASISLTVYIFAIFTILTILDIANAQAKIATALNTSTKEFSEYSYFYFLANADKFENKIGQGKRIKDQGIDNVISTFDSISNIIGSKSYDEASENYENAKNSGKKAKDFVVDSFKNPTNILEYFASDFASNKIDQIKNDVIGTTINRLMQKNLKDFEGDTYDDFLKRHRVEPHFDYNNSSMDVTDKHQLITVKLKYKIKVFDFFKFDIEMPIEQEAKTYAWSLGVEN